MEVIRAFSFIIGDVVEVEGKIGVITNISVSHLYISPIEGGRTIKADKDAVAVKALAAPPIEYDHDRCPNCGNIYFGHVCARCNV